MLCMKLIYLGLNEVVRHGSGEPGAAQTQNLPERGAEDLVRVH